MGARGAGGQRDCTRAGRQAAAPAWLAQVPSFDSGTAGTPGLSCRLAKCAGHWGPACFHKQRSRLARLHLQRVAPRRMQLACHVQEGGLGVGGVGPGVDAAEERVRAGCAVLGQLVSAGAGAAGVGGMITILGGRSGGAKGRGDRGRSRHLYHCKATEMPSDITQATPCSSAPVTAPCRVCVGQHLPLPAAPPHRLDDGHRVLAVPVRPLVGAARDFKDDDCEGQSAERVAKGLPAGGGGAARGATGAPRKGQAPRPTVPCVPLRRRGLAGPGAVAATEVASLSTESCRGGDGLLSSCKTGRPASAPAVSGCGRGVGRVITAPWQGGRGG